MQFGLHMFVADALLVLAARPSKQSWAVIWHDIMPVIVQCNDLLGSSQRILCYMEVCMPGNQT